MRQQQKKLTRQRILDTAASQFRRQGYSATGISEVMQQSELTNGAFYAHFCSKEELLIEAACEAGRQMREQWIDGLQALMPKQRLLIMLERYLDADHRDNPELGCIVPTLGAEIARQSVAVKHGFQRQTQISLQPMIDDLEALGAPEPEVTAWSLLSLCAGAILVSRSMAQRKLSDAVLSNTLEQAKILVAASTKAK